MRIAPRLDRQYLNALAQQHSGFALHLRAVLQVFNGFDPLSQLDLNGGQRLFRQRRARFGGITLPCQSISQIQLANGQQGIGFGSPFSRNGFLALAAFEFV